MAEDRTVHPGTQVLGTDLDEEPITLPDGTRLDETAARELGEELADEAAARRDAGRPSLTAPGVHSPQISARVSAELRASLDRIAAREGIRSSELVRRALQEYVRSHG